VNDVISAYQIAKIKYVKVKQLEDGYVRFAALSLFFYVPNFVRFDAGMLKVTANDKVGRFLGHGVYTSNCRRSDRGSEVDN